LIGGHADESSQAVPACLVNRDIRLGCDEIEVQEGPG
jgi:hypothetical protein